MNRPKPERLAALPISREARACALIWLRRSGIAHWCSQRLVFFDRADDAAAFRDFRRRFVA